MEICSIDLSSIENLKISFSLRRVCTADISALAHGRHLAPRAGDIVMARFNTVGQHRYLQLHNGRKAKLFPGDTLLVAYGNRYAPDQFEAVIPGNLRTCALVAGGGIAAEVIRQSGRVRTASVIEPLGLAADSQGRVLNVSDYALAELPWQTPNIPIVAVAGTAMNAGKTETVVNLTKGLTCAGLRVGVVKVTGTGAGGDIWAAIDAGGSPVLDFTDAGLASTYHVPVDILETVARRLIGHALAAGVDCIVMELADGLFQQETAALLQSQDFTSLLHGVIFAAGDAMGAVAGIQWLQTHTDLTVFGAGGVLTMSPLAMHEARQCIGLPVFDLPTLSHPDIAHTLLDLRLTEEAAGGTG